MSLAKQLQPEKALIFRITHRDNVEWILDHGLHCASSSLQDPGFVPIGSTDVIEKRKERRVDSRPLTDYVPFYFTPRTPMLYNIVTGREGVKKRERSEIVILVSSLHELERHGVEFLFTDRNAAIRLARYTSEIADLREWLPWKDLQRSDFKRDSERPDKLERYMAEALAHRHVPVEALRGLVCYDEGTESTLAAAAAARDLPLKIFVRRDWYC